jgi:hypothetical protein
LPKRKKNASSPVESLKLKGAALLFPERRPLVF